MYAIVFCWRSRSGDSVSGERSAFFEEEDAKEWLAAIQEKAEREDPAWSPAIRGRVSSPI